MTTTKGLERISLGSYKVGAILLTGLFFYDIFWVFGTEVRFACAQRGVGEGLITPTFAALPHPPGIVPRSKPTYTSFASTNR